MRKSTKGALAGSAAAVLLLGGFGTQAAWQAEGEVPGGDINTGHLKLTSNCGAWNLVNAALNLTKSVVEADLDAVRMIPGDVLSRLCTFTVHVEGDNLVAAELRISNDPEVLDGTDPLDFLVAAADFVDEDGDEITGPVELGDGDTIDAKLSVRLPGTLTGLDGQDLAGLLEGLTVTATQA